MRALILSLAILGVGPVTSRIAAAEPHGPTEAPPAPHEEHATPRHGQVWIGGQYEWRAGTWAWKAGHFEARRKNKRWTPGRWEQQGDHWAWVAGTWVDAPKEHEAPPMVVVEEEQRRHGFVWVKGYWQWVDGSYDWIAGHLEPKKKAKRWTDGRWQDNAGTWTWIAGTWGDAPKEPDTAPPSPPVEESGKTRTGFFWIKGNYAWQDGSYEWVPGHWEREREGHRWVDAHWDSVAGKWAFTAGAWQ